MNKINDILFPIEIINRELDYKIFLAVMCAKSTNRIYIGQHDAIYRLAKHLHRGVYVGKNIFREEWPLATLDRYKMIKKNGFIFVHLDEEGGIYPGREEQWKERLARRLDPKCLAGEDFICTWGDFQKKYYSSLNPECAPNIHSTGYPKFDLYKKPYSGYYEDTAGQIKDLYGDFILFNTNFAYANYGLSHAGVFSERLGYNIKDEVIRTKYISGWAHENNIYVEFIKLINFINLKFPEMKIVVRPHPCEDQETYKTIFGGMKNIHIVHNGSVVPWLQACRVMIHNGCTTAVEAAFLNTKIINFKPVEDPEMSLFLPNLIGAECRNEEQVADLVSALLGSDEKACDFTLNGDAYDLMKNFNSSDGLLKFVDIVSRAEDALGAAGSGRDSFRYNLSELFYNFYDLSKKVIRPLFREKAKKYKFFVNPNMFSDFDPADIRDRVRRVENILKVKVDIKFCSKEIFSVQLK